MVVFGQICCIWAKLVQVGHKLYAQIELISPKYNQFARKQFVVFGQTGYIWAEVDVFGQSGCILAKLVFIPAK